MPCEFRRAVLGAVLLFAIPEACFADATLDEGVVRILQDNAEKLGPITCKWERVRQSEFAVDELCRRLGISTQYKGWLEPQTVDFKWARGAFRERRDYASDLSDRDGVFVRAIVEWAFDGLAYYELTVADQHCSGSLGVHTLQWMLRDRPDWGMVEQPDYFYCAGFVLPATTRQLGDDARSLVLASVAANGSVRYAAIETVEKGALRVECILPENKRRTIELDPSLGYAVKGFVDRDAQGRVLFESRSHDFFKLPDRDLWLPRRCEATRERWYAKSQAASATPLLSETYRLLDVDDGELAPDEFRVRAREQIPGTLVHDGTLPGAEKLPEQHVSYFLPADEEDLEDAIAAGLAGGSYSPTPRRRWLGLALAGLAFLAAILFGALAVRRRARTGASQ